ncbi:MAG: nitroreductase family protein [Acetobacteraceae bacterium]|nr:nitroreductase family protein [Acetobacteraceae bacterium]
MEALRSLRLAAEFSDRPVDEAEVLEVLEAVRWTPSAANTQPWEVVVVRGEGGRGAVSQAALDPLLRADGELKPSWPQQAPVLLVFCADVLRVKCRFGEAGLDIARQDVAAAALAAGLAAGELGLAGVFVREVDGAALARSLGLPPGLEPVGVLALGHPASPPSRPPVLEVAAFTHMERWGGGRMPGGPAPEGASGCPAGAAGAGAARAAGGAAVPGKGPA